MRAQEQFTKFLILEKEISMTLKIFHWMVMKNSVTSQILLFGILSTKIKVRWSSELKSTTIVNIQKLIKFGFQIWYLIQWTKINSVSAQSNSTVKKKPKWRPEEIGKELLNKLSCWFKSGDNSIQHPQTMKEKITPWSAWSNLLEWLEFQKKVWMTITIN